MAITKAVVSLSGGMDSATVLGECLTTGNDVLCVGFTYGSKHNRWENEAARQVAAFYRVPFRLLDLSAVMAGFASDLLLSGGEVPKGHYEEESMRRTVVPARNLIFISVLTGVAWSEGATEIWLGVHAGDHFIYPDCRPEFIAAMQRAVSFGTDRVIRLITPFLHGNKESILRTGLKLTPRVPYHLTRTCYTTNEIACGKCGSCQERLAGWRALGLDDPIPYETREELARASQ